MFIRSIKLVAAATVFVAGTAAAQGQMQAVPRAGVAFADSVTVRAKVESIDSDTRTIAFTRPDGRLIHVAVADSVRNLDSIVEESNATVTYTEIVTILNLRQKGPGAREARREGANPDKEDAEIGRFTLTVVAVDLAGNKVSVIPAAGGAVRTYAATSVAQKDALQKVKVGDVVVGVSTPMTVTAIAPIK
jgi:hypothetical protein